MNVLSLFDGISCGQVALNNLGFAPNYYASEIEESAIKICKQNFPETTHIGDVQKITRVPVQIDLLLGGSPCQGFSSAGKGLNFDDPRSKLFFDFVRVKNLSKPKNFLFENVKMKKEWLDIISEYLEIEPVFIDSCDFLPQRRQRCYWTDIKIKPWQKTEIKLTNILEPGWKSDRDHSYCIDANYGKGTNLKRYLFRGSRQIVFRHDFDIDNYNLTEDNCNEFGQQNKGKWRKLSVLECERLQGLPEFYTYGQPEFYSYHGIGNGWTVPVIEHILSGIVQHA